MAFAWSSIANRKWKSIAVTNSRVSIAVTFRFENRQVHLNAINAGRSLYFIVTFSGYRESAADSQALFSQPVQDRYSPGDVASVDS
jgi:hypothetical protein